MLARAFLLLLFSLGCSVDGDQDTGPPGTYGEYDGHAYRCHGADQARAGVCSQRQFATCETDGAGCRWAYVVPGPAVDGLASCSRVVDVGTRWVGGEP
jgi:hypothetical protein